VQYSKATTSGGGHLLVNIATAFAQFDGERNWLADADKDTYPLVLSPEEIAALWHLPSEQCQAPNVYWAAGKTSAIPADVARQKQGILLGTNEYRGDVQNVRLDYPDRVTHVNIIGRTRVGKSTFIHNLVHADIANGKGVGVIDPHGDLSSFQF